MTQLTHPQLAPTGATPRTRVVLILVAAAVTIVEIAAVLASFGAEPFAPVAGWVLSRPPDVAALVLVAVGGGTLLLLPWRPELATVIAALSYCAFMLRDYEFGGSLPAMVAILWLLADGGRRWVAIAAATGCVAVSMVWVANRASTVTDPGVAMLIWVAFGTVVSMFFFGPLLIGELARVRRQLRNATMPHLTG